MPLVFYTLKHVLSDMTETVPPYHICVILYKLFITINIPKCLQSECTEHITLNGRGSPCMGVRCEMFQIHTRCSVTEEGSTPEEERVTG